MRSRVSPRVLPLASTDTGLVTSRSTFRSAFQSAVTVTPVTSFKKPSTSASATLVNLISTTVLLSTPPAGLVAGPVEGAVAGSSATQNADTSATKSKGVVNRTKPPIGRAQG